MCNGCKGDHGKHLYFFRIWAIGSGRDMVSRLFQLFSSCGFNVQQSGLLYAFVIEDIKGLLYAFVVEGIIENICME